MKKIIPFILISILLLSAGEKKKISLLGFIASPVLIDTNVYGNVQVTRILQDNGKGRYYDAMITASFKDFVNAGNTPVNSVKYDSIQLKLRPDLDSSYSDTSGNQPVVGKLWEVDGTGIIPSFSFTPTNEEPDYHGFAFIPTSASLNSGLVIPLSDISNATNVSIQVSDGINVVNQDIYLNGAPIARGMYMPTVNGSNVTFSSGSLGVLSNTENGFLQIIVTNVNIRFFNGKRIAFTNMFLYRRSNFIIN